MTGPHVSRPHVSQSRWTRHGRARRSVRPLALLLILSAYPARSHESGAWGGLFRSRDDGATWVSANHGPFLSGAIAVAIDPADTNHLLLGAGLCG